MRGILIVLRIREVLLSIQIRIRLYMHDADPDPDMDSPCVTEKLFCCSENIKIQIQFFPHF